MGPILSQLNSNKSRLKIEYPYTEFNTQITAQFLNLSFKILHYQICLIYPAYCQMNSLLRINIICFLTTQLLGLRTENSWVNVTWFFILRNSCPDNSIKQEKSTFTSENSCQLICPGKQFAHLGKQLSFKQQFASQHYLQDPSLSRPPTFNYYFTEFVSF